MPLSERERWIHYFSLISVFGFVEHIPRNELMQLAETIRQGRCRKLSREEADGIIKEIGDETLHGQIAMDDLLETLKERDSKHDM